MIKSYNINGYKLYINMESYLINLLSKEIKPEGFKKKKHTWLRVNENISYIIDFQPSKSNTKGDEDFAINIGFFSFEVFSLCWGTYTKKDFNITDCCFHGRLADFVDVKSSWFSINGINDIIKISEETNHLISTEIIPFLSKITTYNDLYILMKNHYEKVIQKELHQIYMACVEYLDGNKENALARLNTIKDNVWEEKALEVKNRIIEDSSRNNLK